MSRVVESAEFIASQSKYVTFGPETKYIEAASVIGPMVKSWKPETWESGHLNPSNLPKPELKANWIFLVDTLNFAFWTPPDAPPFTVSYKGKAYTGYWSLCAALCRAVDDGIDVLNPSFWMNANKEEWMHVFRSETATEVPLFEERLRVLKEAGTLMIQEYEGKPLYFIRSAHNSANNLVELVRSKLVSYRDECTYKGRTVYFLKRAQILAADLHFAFLNDDNQVASICRFDDIEKLTMFADYRVPQALNYLGLIKYSEELLTEMHERPHFPSGSEMECEIRALSIAAVEKLKPFIGDGVISVLIDFILWGYAKENSEAMDYIPIHKTKSVFY